MLETFEDRVSSIESQVSKKRLICSHLKYIKCFALIGIASKHSTIRLQTKRDFFLRQLVFKTKCRPAVDDGNLPVHVNADIPLRSEPFVKLLK